MAQQSAAIFIATTSPSKTISQVTNTPESEYSPTVTPDGRHISVIRVESDGTQRLWQFTLDGREPTVLCPGIKPVGYHAWADASVLVLFVLGAAGAASDATGSRHRRQANLRWQRPVSGGRFSASRAAGSASSRVRQQKPAKRSTLTVTELDPVTRKTRALVTMPPGATDADTAWTPDGLLLASVKGQICPMASGRQGNDAPG